LIFLNISESFNSFNKIDLFLPYTLNLQLLSFVVSIEVINICDARRLGCVLDVDIDYCTGAVNAIVVPGCGRNFFSCFKPGTDIVIPWENIKKIGEEIILVEI
jgi:YlmC/YmxH family sporulation protein